MFSLANLRMGFIINESHQLNPFEAFKTRSFFFNHSNVFIVYLPLIEIRPHKTKKKDFVK